MTMRQLKRKGVNINSNSSKIYDILFFKMNTIFTSFATFVKSDPSHRPKASVSDIDGGSAEIASGSSDRLYI